MLIGIDNDGINFEEWRHCAVRGPDRVARKDRIAEIAGVTEVMTSSHRGSIGGGEGRERRVRISEIHAFITDFGHRGRGRWRDYPSAQPVRHEQNQIVWRGVLGGSRTGG